MSKHTHSTPNDPTSPPHLLPEGLYDALEGRGHISEVGNAAANQQRAPAAVGVGCKAKAGRAARRGGAAQGLAEEAMAGG
jgi:hypothetical protein